MLFIFLLINSIFNCFSIVTDLFKPEVINICNNNISNPNCQARPTDPEHSQYQCTELFQSQHTICGCNSSIEASVIIIIDASDHTRNEWQFITLRWLEMYYDAIYSYHSHTMRVYYMLSHGDFTLTSLNEELSYLATDAFMDNLNKLAEPNACVAFKRANEWLLTHDDINTAIIYYTKATPFAPSFKYKCRNEDEQQYTLLSGKDIFAIKYTDDINLNYVQRDIGEFAYETTFTNNYDVTVTGSSDQTEEIASSIAAAVSDFVCTRREAESLTTQPSKRNIVQREDDCCSHVSGIEYSDIEMCDLYQIQEIEEILTNKECLFYCNPFPHHLETETEERNWDCIINYALWVQLYHICDDLELSQHINQSMWNDYRWHCPLCYNESVYSFKSVCRSGDGQQDILDAYIAENCDCKDVTLFLVVIIEITALFCILIGMFVLWYRFNIALVKQYLRDKSLEAVNAPNQPEEIVLNDLENDDGNDSD